MIDCDLVDVSGPDAATYLHGQLSQDIESMDVGTSAVSFLLSPSGHIDAWLRVHRVGDSVFTLEVESGHGRETADRLAKFLLRPAAVVAAPRSARVLRWRGDPSVKVPFDADPAVVMTAGVDWAGFSGVDFVGPDDVIHDLGTGLGVVPPDSSSPSRVESARIRAGVPRFGIDIDPGSVPATAGSAVIAASVSFTKGCYTGQELVARMNSRGGQAPVVVRRLSAESSLSRGAQLEFAGEVVGVVTSAAGMWALAAVKRKVSPGDVVVVDGTSARIDSLPGEPISGPA